ncbi:hypothetical protein AVEN_70474-1 [Araneus ventricosus]|uniref:Tc1-like transposase DDE domain-containing protein n=1 Tax=Araneus ventricosus TaxID=182803 RepID=A0A4Y2H415_ARAVE|nr:hypothetical protein AVEN_70474-1 [Araneus ventricosus]
MHPDCKFVRQSGDSTCCAAIHEQHSRGVFQQDNARPHTAVVTQYAIQSVDMLPWPARSPDLSPIEHVWDIIGRQLQSHPQLALIVPVLTDQVQLHPTNWLVCMLAFKVLVVTPVINVPAFHI